MLSRACLLTWGEKFIKNSLSPRLDAEVILSFVCKTERSSLISHSEKRLSFIKVVRFGWLMWRRCCGVPVAYLIKQKLFYGRKFYVNKHTLIPRPETELLIVKALELINNNRELTTIADIGTGSGCIAITLALETKLPILACDISTPALNVAKTNALSHQVNNLKFLAGNLLTPLINNNWLSPQTLVVANLPYLNKTEITSNLKYEPRLALVAKEEGLALYHLLFKQLASLPTPQRPQWVMVESHPKTLNKFQKIFYNYFAAGQLLPNYDYLNLPRVFTLKLY